MPSKADVEEIIAWDKAKKSLISRALETLPEDLPDIRLIVAIIISAGKEKDLDYLRSDLFVNDCFLIDLDPFFTRKTIYEVWDNLKCY